MQWFKLFCEWGSDPKVQTLSEADQRRHVMLLCLHKMGDLEKATDEDVAFFMRISTKQWLQTKAKFEQRNLIECSDNGSVCIPTWDKRQGARDYSTPRVQEWRKRHTCIKCGKQDKEIWVERNVVIRCPFCGGE